MENFKSKWKVQLTKHLMSLLETQDPVSPIGSMSQWGIYVLVGNHYDTMVLYYIIHWIAKYKNVIH